MDSGRRPGELRLQGARGKIVCQARSTRNARSLNPQARTFRTEIDIPNPKGKLLPGMYVQASIDGTVAERLDAAAPAVATEGDQTFCYRVEGGKAVRTPLQVGAARRRVGRGGEETDEVEHVRRGRALGGLYRGRGSRERPDRAERRPAGGAVPSPASDRRGLCTVQVPRFLPSPFDLVSLLRALLWACNCPRPILMVTTPTSLLAKLAGSTEPAPWTRFVELYTPLLLCWGRRLGLDEHDAADLVQDLFTILVVGCLSIGAIRPIRSAPGCTLSCSTAGATRSGPLRLAEGG